MGETAVQSEETLRIGDLVVVMTEPGIFRVIELMPPSILIESPVGVRRKVREWAVRRVDATPPVPR